MKQSAGRWTAFTILLLALSILGLLCAVLYAKNLAVKTGANRAPTAASCPSPTADFPKKENKPMTTALQKGMIPLIDKALPARVETATFGLG